MNWQHLKKHAPNELQLVPLKWIVPSAMNVRLFIERESLESLEKKYRAWLKNPSTVLPDAPTIRYLGEHNPFELLAGHRRLEAAAAAGCDAIYCRIVSMSDEEAYRFIREANNYETLTTVEKAYSVAEMDRLGYSHTQIRETLGNIGVTRYVTVGRMLDPDWFTDIEKLCDPSITLWGYATRHGRAHFERCFKHWDAGRWDEETCSREFRKAGSARPPEPYQAGAILSVDETGSILRFRGTLDLNMLTPDELQMVVGDFTQVLETLEQKALNEGSFGNKVKLQFSPDDA